MAVQSSGRLRVVRSGDGVFKARVSNQNIANILAVIGAIRLGSSCVFLHSSMAVAQRFFLSLPPYCSEEDEDAVIAFTDKPTTKLTSVAGMGPLACLVSGGEAQLATAHSNTELTQTSPVAPQTEATSTSPQFFTVVGSQPPTAKIVFI